MSKTAYFIIILITAAAAFYGGFLVGGNDDIEVYPVASNAEQNTADPIVNPFELEDSIDEESYVNPYSGVQTNPFE